MDMISAKSFHRYILFIGSITGQIIEEMQIKDANVLYIILYPLIITPPKNLFEY